MGIALGNFVFFTDSHIRLTATRRRTDDMFEAQLKKLEWIIKRAEELGSEFIVCGGDIGDAWDWKISMVNRVAEVLKKSSIPIYTIVGNHDVPGRNPKLWQDTGLGLLHNLKAIHVLPSGEAFTYTSHSIYWPDEFSFVLVGFDSDASETDDLISGKWNWDMTTYNPEEESPNKCKVAIVHAAVGAESTPYCKGHKELFINGFDVALFGDIHPGWPVYDSITGCKICNPGSMTRLNKTDLERIPKIAVVESDGSVTYEDIPCTPAKECFDYDKMDAELQEIGKGFLAAMAAKKITTEDLDPKQYVEKIGSEAGYSKEAIKLLKDEL